MPLSFKRKKKKHQCKSTIVSRRFEDQLHCQLSEKEPGEIKSGDNLGDLHRSFLKTLVT